MQLPDSLKRFRKAYKLTQKQTAALLGVKERMYQLYEHGDYEPSISSLIALADHYNISLDYLCGRSDNPERI